MAMTRSLMIILGVPLLLPLVWAGAVSQQWLFPDDATLFMILSLLEVAALVWGVWVIGQLHAPKDLKFYCAGCYVLFMPIAVLIWIGVLGLNLRQSPL